MVYLIPRPVQFYGLHAVFDSPLDGITAALVGQQTINAETV